MIPAKASRPKLFTEQRDLYRIAFLFGQAVNSVVGFRRPFVQALLSLPELQFDNPPTKTQRYQAYGLTFFDISYEKAQDKLLLHVRPTKTPVEVAEIYKRSLALSGKWHAYFKSGDDAQTILHGFFFPEVDIKAIHEINKFVSSVLIHKPDTRQLAQAIAIMSEALKEAKELSAELRRADRRARYRKAKA